jgi:hypothetical protein
VTLFGGETEDETFFLSFGEGEVVGERCFTGDREGEEVLVTPGLALPGESVRLGGDSLLLCRGEGESEGDPRVDPVVRAPAVPAVTALMRS